MDEGGRGEANVCGSKKGPRPVLGRQLGTPWVLENGQGVKTHTGTLEGGLSGPNANYFLLFKEGSSFRCVPLPLWYNFRPAIK